MAHEVSIRLYTKIMAHKDLEIEVKTSGEGKLGTLLISKGNIEWLPKGNHVNKRSLTWRKFAELMEDEGKEKKVKKGR